MRVARLCRSLIGLALALTSLGAAAQVTGTRNIPGDYATLAAAITDVNTVGVGAGGATLNLLAGNAQTSIAGGYVVNTTASPATTSAANPLIIVGNGNTITAPITHTVGSLTDAIFKIVGSDSVTISGFTMLENAANTTTAAGTNNMTEFGVAVSYATTTDGAQNATIQNNTITLNRTYQNTFGIYSNSTHSSISITAALATTALGGNHGLKIYGNTINNVNQGISVVGTTAAADMNTGVDIGGSSGAQGNIISNWGTTGTFSSYPNVSGTINGILVRNSPGFNISNNTLTSSVGGNTVTTSERGIYVPSFTVVPTGTFASTINGNNISIQSGFVTGTLNGIIVETNTGTATSSITINTNNFNTFGHTVASPTGAVNFINDTMANLNTTISFNTFTSISLTTTGNVLFIGHSLTNPPGGTDTINNNSIVTSFAKTGTGGGALTFINNSAGSSLAVTQNWNNNNFSNITIPGATTIAGIVSADGGTVNHNVVGNTVSNIVGGTGSIVAINTNFGGQNGGTGNLVSGNTIANITSAGAITGITVGTSGTGSITTITGNTINNLSSSGASIVVGVTSSSPATCNILKNKIYDLGGSNAGSLVNGITVAAGLTHTISNNLIGNLTAPAATGANAINGINVTSTVASSTINLFYNSIYINNPTSGAGFGSSGVFHAASATATTAALNLRNNVIVNTSVQNGAGLTVAYRRSVGTAGTLANYATTSNNNDFYAGTPSATNLIYFDGVSTASTIAAYRAGVFTAGTIAPRDSASVGENPPFLSTTGSSATFLHINTTVATQLESGGSPVSIIDDFDGDARSGSTPDIGADEFAGIALDLNGPAISYTAVGNTTQTSNRTINATITDASGVASGGNAPRIYFRKNGGAYFSNQCAGASPAYTCTIDNAMVGGVVVADVINYFVIAQDTVGNVSANPAAGLVASDVNTVTTPPTTANSYTIVAAFPGAVNVGTGETFTSLTNVGGLFEAMNNGVLTSNVTALVTSDLSAESGTVALNPFAENGVGGYSLTIQSNAAVERLIVGAAAGGLIRLNGADRVSFDGSFGGSGRFLRFRNTAVGPAFLLQNDATLNNIFSSFVESANTGATSGTIAFGTAGGLAGNSVNVISNCEIRDRSDAAGVPANAVYSSGTAGAANASNSVLQSNIYNYTGNGVQVAAAGAGDSWVVTGNSFYQTAARTTALSGVTIAGGAGHTINGNSMGGNAPSAGGAFLATSGIFSGIDLLVGTALPTSVQGNVVKNIRSTSVAFTASYGIRVQAGTVNIGNVQGNYIGAADPNERFEINGDSYGIRVASTAAVNVSNNTVNNMGTSPTVPAGEFYFGISMEGAAGAHTVVNNTVTNLTNGSAPDASFNTQTIGLIVSATGAQTIRGNTVANIGATNTAVVATLNHRVWGVILSATGPGSVFERNRVVDVFASSPSTGVRADVVTAVQLQALANATLSNNMVSTSGGGASSDRSVFGLLDLNAAGVTANYYFNSVNVFGTATTANNSYAFNRNGTGTVSLRNNIFANSRAGGTGFHVAMANTNAAATGWSATASNNNVLFNATAAHLTQWLGAAVGNNQTLAGFQTASGGDAATISADPLFISNTDLHLGAGSPAMNIGVPFGGVTIDFDGDTRSATAPEIGADEIPSYSVGGNVTGLSGTGLVLQNNLGDDLSVSANGTFTFATSLANGATYSVSTLTQPGSPAQTCLVTNGSGTIAGANVTDVAVACTTNTYTVGGNVTGLSGTGLVLQNNLGDNLSVSGSSFTFTTPVTSGNPYSVTVLTQPGSPTQTCLVTNGSGTIAAANVTNVAVACTTNTYTVGGTVSGLVGSGPLVLQNNLGNDLSLSANGAFTFTTPVASGATYSVTVLTQPGSPTQTCLVTNGSGTIASANVTDVAVACTTNTFTVGGNVTGLVGTGLVLQNNGGNNLAIAGNGAFTFTTPVASGAPYAVTVSTQPGSPSQTCLVTNGSGTIAAANVTNVAVACSSANLSIVKTSSVTLLQSGMMQYTITASNAGPDAVTGARIQDTFAGSLSSITWSCTPTGGASCANGTGNIDQLVNMPVSSTVVYSVTATVATPFPNSISNTATITAPVGVPDPAAGDNTSTVVDQLIIFRDGFEDIGPIAPSLISLPLARAGITETLALSLPDIRRLAVNANPVEVVSFDIQGTLAVVQSRQVGGELQVRLLQRNVDGSWLVGNWTDLGTAGGVSFDWSNGAAAVVSALRFN